jgi:hypothetical protein
VEQGRERIEDFIRRYWHEGNRVFRVLAVAEHPRLGHGAYNGAPAAGVGGVAPRPSLLQRWFLVAAYTSRFSTDVE